MGKLKRSIALLLTALLLCGCTAEPALSHSGEREKIAYIPIDDRPDNVERAEYLAESLDYELCMPEKDMYATKLNSQPLNENGTQHGDRDGLFAWLTEQEKGGCNRYIISLDQLLSGGLVNSRDMAENESIVIDGKSYTETQALDMLIELLGADEDNRVWLLDSVMRLAPTVGYGTWDAESYENVRSYASVPRMAAELSLEEIEQSYRLDADNNIIPLADFGISEEQAERYFAARCRKLEPSDYLLSALENKENFSVLIGIDDSSEKLCIQKNEIAYLSEKLREGDAILSGVDDLAFKSIAKLYLDESGFVGCKVNVAYFGESEEKPACIYDYRPLNELVEEHLSFFGMEKSGDAELQVLVLTAPADEARAGEYLDGIIDSLNDNRKEKLPTILIDASDSHYGTEFLSRFISETEAGYLLSYSGSLDMAIVTGTALSHGVARYAFLQNGKGTAETESAYMRSLADSVIKDVCYRSDVRAQVQEYVASLGGSANNHFEPQLDKDALNSFLADKMELSTEKVLKNLENSSYIYSLGNYAERGWGSITLSDYSFPWNRSFEISMKISITED